MSIDSADPQFTPDWLDRMYNNRALVPDHAVYLARWARQSVSVREHAACRLDIAYGAGNADTLDVFPASTTDNSGDSGAPVLVFIHGGYWRGLDKADHSFLAPYFTRAGACVVVPNYALCPAVTIPEIVRQMGAAIAWTWRHIADFGGNPARITVAGYSAGGHLAAMLLAHGRKPPGAGISSGSVKHALSISGLYDLEPLRCTPFLKDLRLMPAHVASASPARLCAPAHGQLVSVVGGDESEEFLRQNQLIRHAWGPDAVPVCEPLPGLNHFSILEKLVEPGHRLSSLALGLLGLESAAGDWHGPGALAPYPIRSSFEFLPPSTT